MPRRNRIRSAARVTDPKTQRALTWEEAIELFLQAERLKGFQPRTIRRHLEVFAVSRKELDTLKAGPLPPELKQVV